MIGGPDGVSPNLRDDAELCLAFGAATWPHQLVRIMLLEQLYRAVTILAGHPYHRGRMTAILPVLSRKVDGGSAVFRTGTRAPSTVAPQSNG